MPRKRRFKSKAKPRYRKSVKKPTATSKKFGGKNYGLYDVYTKKDRAKSMAKRLKGLGINARVVGTAVYSRRK